MKSTAKPKIIHLKDYKAPDYFTPEVELWFNLQEEHTRVKSRLQVVRRSKSAAPLILNGEKLRLISVHLDGKKLPSSSYQVDDKFLTIQKVPAKFTLEIETEIEPQNNKTLEGLYRSRGIFCTQMEAQGFRAVTYFVDRPDNMARFTTHIQADSKKYPVLLSNGNLINSRHCEEPKRGDVAISKMKTEIASPLARNDKQHIKTVPNRHEVTWEDPFPKPCYLFALVGGNLGMIEDHFITRSRRKVTLRIYVEKGNEARASYAMESLKRAMKWDEKTFGLEYDLDLYMIVAVDDFNFGAMENKGLNIFNSQYVLANPQTATDQNFQAIEGVIGHEYFHNWTGNRVTCRDWFQLTLKEGLTVFRDQEFSSDVTSRAVKRMEDVRFLKDVQFIEDAGPNAHPIRPASYIEVNNFYTSTVYQKGAEVIRMIETFIGKEAFKKGITKYFELYDGQAVTTDQFVHAMELVSGCDLTHFKRWYAQPGTPIVQVKGTYDAKKKIYQLEVVQKKPNHPLAKKNKPYYFPLKMALLFKDDKAEIASAKIRPRNDVLRELKKDVVIASALLRRSESSASQRREAKQSQEERVLVISKPRQVFSFKNIPSKPVPSLLRNFSAPVKLETTLTRDDLIYLLANDTDLINRYEAGQKLLSEELLRVIRSRQQKKLVAFDTSVLTALGSCIDGKSIDPAFSAEALILPGESSLLQSFEIYDFDLIHETRRDFIKAFAIKYSKELGALYQKFHVTKKYSIDPVSIGRRSLKNIALRYLQIAGDSKATALIFKQYQTATNMSDSISALAMLCDTDQVERASALKDFYRKWQKDPLVMNKWFAVQASSRRAELIADIKRLEKDPAFDVKNPNKLRSLYGVFAGNLIRFHDLKGTGYRLFAEKILEINKFNPGIAAKLSAAGFKHFSKLDSVRRPLMKTELNRILKSKPSQDVFEIISKTLASAKK